jgi:hypothetical protein
LTCCRRCRAKAQHRAAALVGVGGARVLHHLAPRLAVDLNHSSARNVRSGICRRHHKKRCSGPVSASYNWRASLSAATTLPPTIRPPTALFFGQAPHHAVCLFGIDPEISIRECRRRCGTMEVGIYFKLQAVEPAGRLPE